MAAETGKEQGENCYNSIDITLFVKLMERKKYHWSGK
jgi:hypothetical protein